MTSPESGVGLTDVQERLQRVWVEVLGLDAVAAEDDFFAISGDSMMALELTARTREEFSVDVAVRIVFDNPTVAEMSAAVHQELSARGRDAR
jgi:acyl carrier protein